MTSSNAGAELWRRMSPTDSERHGWIRLKADRSPKVLPKPYRKHEARLCRSRVLLGDSDFTRSNEDVQRMIDPHYAALLKKSIDFNRTFAPSHYGRSVLRQTAAHRTSASLTRRQCRSATETINLPFGSLVVPPGTGIISITSSTICGPHRRAERIWLKMSERNVIRAGQRP